MRIVMLVFAALFISTPADAQLKTGDSMAGKWVLSCYNNSMLTSYAKRFVAQKTAHDPFVASGPFVFSWLTTPVPHMCQSVMLYSAWAGNIEQTFEVPQLNTSSVLVYLFHLRTLEDLVCGDEGVLVMWSENLHDRRL